jgi:hypothetical protein
MKQLTERGFRSLTLMASLLCLSSGASYAQNQQQAIVNGMRQIASNWNAAIRDGSLFLEACTFGGWAAKRLSTNTTVSFDVKKTDSLVSPYVGILVLTGVVESNSTCDETPDAALARNDFTPNLLLPRELVAYYNFDGQRFTLSGGSQVFKNVILSALTTPSAHNSEVISKFGLIELRVKTN